MPAIRISVVIPLYNKEKEVLRALESVFAQTRLPDEVIVVDDGSTDQGPMLVEQKYGHRIKMIRLTNKGVSSARNAGIRAAESEFICLLDADDEWMPGYLEEINKLADDFPEAVFYSTNVNYIDENGRQFQSAIACPDDFFGEVADFASTFSKGYGLVSSSSVCLKKVIFNQRLIFPEGVNKGEDIYLWLQLGLKGRLAFSAKPLVTIYLNASNRSPSKPGVLPYQFLWYLDNKAEIMQMEGGKSVRRFILGNAFVTAYGLAMTGDLHTVRLMVRIFFIRRDFFFLAILPALIVPRFLLNFLRVIRRKRVK